MPDRGTCGERFAAMDANGWGYVECILPAGHTIDPAKRGSGHRPESSIVHDGGEFRLAHLPLAGEEA